VLGTPPLPNKTNRPPKACSHTQVVAAHRIATKADPEIEEHALAIWANAAASGFYDVRSKQPNPR
jgi:hypothetical protein